MENKPFFLINTCENCETHLDHTQHNSEKYTRYGNDMKNRILNFIPGATVYINDEYKNDKVQIKDS